MFRSGANRRAEAGHGSRDVTCKPVVTELCIQIRDIAVQHLRKLGKWLNYMQRFSSAYFVCTCHSHLVFAAEN